ncbi:peptidylprolyl isomerase [candidate division GN15 bacterium]|nr:peptidylprolyl isomerase [candidate division GN15 bacterium]
MKKVILLIVVGVAMAALSGCGPETEVPVRDSNNKFVTLETSKGNMTVELYRDVAPAHADSFLARTNDGFYNNTKFHRIIRGFMMQGGDPTGTGMGDAGYRLDAEFSDLNHVKGTLSMARGGHDVNSASCQFFICFQETPHLDGQYTVFGQVVNGLATLDSVQQVELGMTPRGEQSMPKEDVMLLKAYESDAEGNPR